jgi:hypothetical protein
MTRFSLSVFALLFFQIISIGQKESGKRPYWVDGTEKGYLIVSATSSSIQLAKDKAFSKVRENVILSVAVQVNYTSSSSVSEKIKNNSRDFSEEFVAKVKLHAGQLGFVNGISESKIADFYWVKTSKKKEPLKFEYYIKYPFSDDDLNSLIADYNREIFKREQELKQLKKEVFSTSNSDSLLMVFQKVKVFRTQPDFYDDNALSLMENEIKEFYKSCRFEISDHELGTFNLKMYRNGRPFMVNIDQLNSDMKGLRHQRDGDGYKCYYDYADMNYSDRGNFDISFNLLGKSQTRNLSIDLESVYPRFNLQRVSIKPFESGITSSLVVKVLNDVRFEIESLELTIKSNSFEFKNKGESILHNRGESEINLTCLNDAQKLLSLLESTYYLADVFIRYKIPDTQFKQTMTLYQQKIQL